MKRELNKKQFKNYNCLRTEKREERMMLKGKGGSRMNHRGGGPHCSHGKNLALLGGLGEPFALELGKRAGVNNLGEAKTR